MRIVVDGSPLCYPLTGIGHYTHSLINALAIEKPSWEIIVLSPYHPTSPVSQPNVFHDLKASKAREKHSTGWRAWWFDAVLPKTTRAIACDIFWAAAGLVPFTLSNTSVALTIHDLVPERYPKTMSWLPRQYRKWNLRYWLSRASILLPNSKATRDETKALFGINPQFVVYPGVDDIFLNYSMTRDKAAARSEYLVVLGTLEPRKNLERLVSSVEDLVLAGIWPKGLLLRIIGGKGWRDESLLSRISHLESSGIAQCPGYVPREALPGLLAGARALLMPSLYEGFGMPLAEAMAVGCPILCSDIAPFREVVGDYPAVLHGTDQASMTEAYRTFLTTPRECLLPDPRETDRYRFTWQRSARQVVEVFENHMQNPRPRR